jgi:hypothetical protein
LLIQKGRVSQKETLPGRKAEEASCSHVFSTNKNEEQGQKTQVLSSLGEKVLLPRVVGAQSGRV